MSTWYYDKALYLIENYIYQLDYPNASMRRQEFVHVSFVLWAADELFTFVKDNPQNPPLDSVSSFIKKMEDFACLNRGTSYIFSTAADTAKDIFDYLLCYI